MNARHVVLLVLSMLVIASGHVNPSYAQEDKGIYLIVRGAVSYTHLTLPTN